MKERNIRAIVIGILLLGTIFILNFYVFRDRTLQSKSRIFDINTIDIDTVNVESLYVASTEEIFMSPEAAEKGFYISVFPAPGFVEELSPAKPLKEPLLHLAVDNSGSVYINNEMMPLDSIVIAEVMRQILIVSREKTCVFVPKKISAKRIVYWVGVLSDAGAKKILVPKSTYMKIQKIRENWRFFLLIFRVF